MTILGLAFFALTGVGLYLGYDALVKKPSEVLTNSVRNAKDVLKTIFAPKGEITVTTTDRFGRPVVMYSLYEKRMASAYTYKNKWLGSEKSLSIRDEFICRYGVDASLNGVQVDWDSPGVIRLDGVQPSLISCEPVGQQVIDEEEGVWNKLQPEERAMAQNAFLQQARKEAAQDTAALRSARDRFFNLIQEESRKHPDSPEIIKAPGL